MRSCDTSIHASQCAHHHGEKILKITWKLADLLRKYGHLDEDAHRAQPRAASILNPFFLNKSVNSHPILIILLPQ